MTRRSATSAWSICGSWRASEATAPTKQKRWGVLGRKEPDLMNRLIEAGLLPGVPFAQEPDGVLDKEQAEEFEEGNEADISYLFEPK